MNQEKKEKISLIVIKILLSRFETFPVDASKNRNAPFHEAFLKAFKDKFNGKVSDVPFFISLSSWLQGLSTSLGQTFFEGVAHILSDGEKREYTSKKLGNIQISEIQKNKINEIMTNLSNSGNPDLQVEDERIVKNNGSQLVNAIDFSADVFIEEDKNIIAIELKSVKPNSGEMRGEKQKILEGKTALRTIFPKKNVKFFIGFPFDPTSNAPTGFDKTRFFKSIINMNKFFDSHEVLLATELWDFLSGEIGTMEKIIEIINTISTPNFMGKFNFVDNPENRGSKEYARILEEWFLFSELKLVKNNIQIQLKIRNDKILQRIYNQQIFKKDEYNWQRERVMRDILGNKVGVL